MRVLTVRRRPGRPDQGLLNIDGQVFTCALGRGGVTAVKREGDGATPKARMKILSGCYRADRNRVAGGTRLRMRRIDAPSGWCDEPADRNYNRPVRLPYPASHERMWRADHLYDICIILDWNMTPRRRNTGSAIFLHIARPGFKPTAGCIAVSPRVMTRLLPYLSARSVVHVVG